MLCQPSPNDTMTECAEIVEMIATRCFLNATNSDIYQNSVEKYYARATNTNILCVWEIGLDFVKFGFVVERH